MVSRWCKIKKSINEKRYSLCSLGIGTIFFVVLYVLTKLLNISVCILKNLFGIECFGCGLTRGFICILECDFKSATSYNVLSIPIFAGFCIYALLLIIDVLFAKTTLHSINKILNKKMMYACYVATFLLSVIINKLI